MHIITYVLIKSQKCCQNCLLLDKDSACAIIMSGGHRVICLFFKIISMYSLSDLGIVLDMYDKKQMTAT